MDAFFASTSDLLTTQVKVFTGVKWHETINECSQKDWYQSLD